MSQQSSGRYQRSVGGMVGAMVVLVAAVVGWVGFRSVVGDDPDDPVDSVAYADDVPAARDAADFALVAPPRLPEGWRATTVRFTDRPDQHWHLGVLTDEGEYVGLEQGDDSVEDMVEQYVDADATPGDPVDVAGTPWTTYSDSGDDLALVRREGDTTTLVVGSGVPRSELVDYAATLR